MKQEIHQPKQVIDKFQLRQLVRDLKRLVERSKELESKNKLRGRKGKKGKRMRY